MNRIELIRAEITRLKRPITYLEIGVEKGNCLLNISAKLRIGVDPRMRIPRGKLFKMKLSRLFSGRRTRLLEITSDRFFEDYSKFMGDRKLDIAFVDGLHTYRQSLIDVENCLKYLADDGAVLMHDCNPPSAAAALPAESIDAARTEQGAEWARDWCGDVWKTIVHLRSTRSNLDVCVVDCDFGVGVIRRKKPRSVLSLAASDVERLTYDDLAMHRQEWLNLISAANS